jgi:hypothetical protein
VGKIGGRTVDGLSDGDVAETKSETMDARRFRFDDVDLVSLLLLLLKELGRLIRSRVRHNPSPQRSALLPSSVRTRARPNPRHDVPHRQRPRHAILLIIILHIDSIPSPPLLLSQETPINLRLPVLRQHVARPSSSPFRLGHRHPRRVRLLPSARHADDAVAVVVHVVFRV